MSVSPAARRASSPEAHSSRRRHDIRALLPGPLSYSDSTDGGFARSGMAAAGNSRRALDSETHEKPRALSLDLGALEFHNRRDLLHLGPCFDSRAIDTKSLYFRSLTSIMAEEAPPNGRRPKAVASNASDTATTHLERGFRKKIVNWALPRYLTLTTNESQKKRYQ